MNTHRLGRPASSPRKTQGQTSWRAVCRPRPSDSGASWGKVPGSARQDAPRPAPQVTAGERGHRRRGGRCPVPHATEAVFALLPVPPRPSRESPPEVRGQSRAVSGTLGRSGNLVSSAAHSTAPINRDALAVWLGAPPAGDSEPGPTPGQVSPHLKHATFAHAWNAAGPILARSDSRMRRFFGAIPGRGPESGGGVVPRGTL